MIHGYAFRFLWRWPQLTAYRAAERRPFALMLNRYGGRNGVVIGAAVQFGQRVFSLVWGKPGGHVKPRVRAAAAAAEETSEAKGGRS